MKEEHVDLSCECGCGIMRFSCEPEYDDDKVGSIFVEYWMPAFYSEQIQVLKTLWRRLVEAVKILRGKKFVLYEVIVSDDDLKELKDWINKL